MKFKPVVPPIKSQGIKTKLVPWIKDVIPAEFDGVWIEPFMGTGVVGLNLAPERALMCDSNPHLVNFYNGIKEGIITPERVRDYLQEEGRKLSASGAEHYYEVRERFNSEGGSLDFLFLSRAGFNGMMRFNKKGGFNIPFCKKPERFAQAYITKITNQVASVSQILNQKDISFRCQGFEETIRSAKEADLIYCDPPYIGRHVDYYNGWDGEHEQRLFDALLRSPSKFILSTWHHNDYRSNEYIDSHWNKFNVLTKDHYYHVGGKESNRNAMVEALVCNFEATIEGHHLEEPATSEQLALLN